MSKHLIPEVLKTRLPETPQIWYISDMSITVKVLHGSISLPPDLNIPDGTEVEIVIPTTAVSNDTKVQSVKLPVFKGDGLQPSVNLDDSRAIRETLDTAENASQF